MMQFECIVIYVSLLTTALTDHAPLEFEIPYNLKPTYDSLLLSYQPFCKPECCIRDNVWFDLTTGNVVTSPTIFKDDFVKHDDSCYWDWYMQDNPEYPGRNCSKTLSISVRFEPVPQHCYECVKSPLCGRRMLRLDFYLHPTGTGGYVFNIGDSPTNDGWGQDAGTQYHDAEVLGFGNSAYAWASQYADPSHKFLAFFQSILGPGVSHVTAYVSNGNVRMTNDLGADESICDEHFFALDHSFDHSWSKNDNVYIGVNRVVHWFAERFGYGVCYVRMSWMCPWC